MLSNFSNEILTITKATILGMAEVSESLVDKIHTAVETNLTKTTKPPKKHKNEALYNKLLQGKLDHLSQEERQHIEPGLLKSAHAFHDEANEFKATNFVEHQLPIGEILPIRRPPYRTPYTLRDKMKCQLQKMLEREIIRKSNSTWSAPTMPKKNPDDKPQFRFCVDFCAQRCDQIFPLLSTMVWWDYRHTFLIQSTLQP